MKILFNNSFISPIERNNKYQTSPTFGEKFYGIDKIPDRDIFVSSRVNKKEYLDDKLLKTVADWQTFSPEIIKLAKINYVAASILKTANEFLKQIQQGELDAQNIKNMVYRDYSPEAIEAFEEFIEQSGISLDEQLVELAQISGALVKKKITNCTKSREIVQLCGSLENPRDLLNYSEILFEACFFNVAFDRDYDYNKIVNFAKAMGAKNEDALLNKTFAHLAPDFNDFKTAEDKLEALEFARKSYEIDRDILETIKTFRPELQNVDIDDFYSRNASLVDYICDKEEDAIEKLYLTMQFDQFYEPIAPCAINALSSVVDAKTPQGRLELYEFIVNEDITPNELTQLTRQSYYDNVSCADVVIDRLDTIKEMVDYYSIPEDWAKVCYLNLGHTINVAKNSDIDFYADPLFVLIFASTNLGFRTDKEFSDFYFELTKGSGKSSKNKKGQQKISQKEAINFINLLSFLEFDLAYMYNQNKKFPLYAELKKRKVEFEKVQDKIEKLIDKHNARRYLKDAFYTYKEYYEHYQTAKNLETFVLDAIEMEKESARESSSLEEKFSYYFGDDEVLEAFLSKNKIKLSEDTSYTKLCNKILDSLVAKKDEKTAQELCAKLAKSDFIINSQNALGKLVASKSEEELQSLLEIALNENIASAQELMLMIKPYLNKQKQIDKLLVHYKAQKLDFRTYLAKLAQIQKDLDNLGFSIVINNDNVQMLNLEELKNNKLNLNQALKIAKEILKEEEGNFIYGLKESSVDRHMPYTAGQIAKELTSSQTGRYKEIYSGFLNLFGLKTSDLGFKNPTAQYEEFLQDVIKKEVTELTSLLNSDIYMYEFWNCQVPNLTLHARMRLIERFILQEGKDPFDEASYDEIKEVLKTVYTKNPYKMEKAKGGFSVYYKYGENEEIKAVFEQNGKMLTIVKNKL